MNRESRVKKARLGVALAAALVVCSLAAGQEVRANYMPGTDFSKYHTYKWVSIEGGAHPNQIVDQEIQQAIDTQMAQKGFTKTNDDTANLYVGYQVAVDQLRMGVVSFSEVNCAPWHYRES